MQAGEKNNTNVDDTYNLRTSAVLLQRHLIEYIIITTARRTKQNRGFPSGNRLPISVERATTGSATRGVRRQKSAERQTDRQRQRQTHILQRLWGACDIIIAAIPRLASDIAENAVACKDASQYWTWFFRSTTPQILPSIRSFLFFALRYTLHIRGHSVYHHSFYTPVFFFNSSMFFDCTYYCDKNHVSSPWDWLDECIVQQTESCSASYSHQQEQLVHHASSLWA